MIETQHNTLKRVVVVGSGNLAEALAHALSQSSLELVGILARNEARGRALALSCGSTWSNDFQHPLPADIYLISVSDRAVAEVAQSLCVDASAVVAHTAGCVPIEALKPHAQRAVFYPLMTFTKGRQVDFSVIPLFLESSQSLMPRMEAFARQLSSSIHHADSAMRERIHLSGVFANNFVNHLYALAEQVVASADLDFDVLKPIIYETAQKACDSSSPRMVQTGPAIRGDQGTQQRHIELMTDDKMKDIYTKISQNIWEISRKI